ncbi:spermidine synthase family protein [Streptomyces mayteni]
MASAPFPHSAAPAEDDRPVVLARGEGPYGEVVLRRHGALLQIIANGCFLMDTSDGRSERLLVTEAFAALAEGPPATRPTPTASPEVLIGGLGVGFSLVAAAAEPGWGGITVLERESAIIDWHRAGPLGELTAAALADPRVRLVHGDLLAHLHEVEAGYDALCLDVDNGPDWTVTEDNEGLYSPAGLAACRAALRPGGILAVWSARGSERFVENLRKAGFTGVGTREVPVARGVPDVLFLASHHLASQSA